MYHKVIKIGQNGTSTKTKNLLSIAIKRKKENCIR